MAYEKKPIENFYKELDCSAEGLAQSEVNKRLVKYGLNTLGSHKKMVLLKVLIDQFTDFLVIILIVAGTLSLILGDVRTASALFIIVVFNAAIGFTQQFRTERTLAALKNMLPHRSQVLRDGKQKEVLSKFLAPGDIVLLQAGDSVPVDGRIVEQYSLKTNESALTGESMPQAKHEHADERHPRADQVFMGTSVVEGEAKVLVTLTGIHTEFGKIAEKTKDTTALLSPLQKKLRQVGVTVAKICGLVLIGIIAYSIIKQVFIDGGQLNIDFMTDVFIFAMSLAAAMVPEGLPATVSVALSIGANRLIKKNAVVKRLASVETLGSTNVICTDKTGTLTIGKMSVVSIFEDDGHERMKFKDYDFSGNNFLLLNFALCQNVKKTDKGLLGDPDEVALWEAVEAKHKNPERFLDKHKKIHEISFNPIRKMMSVLVEVEGDGYILLTKGNPEKVLERSSLNSQEQALELKKVDMMAEDGLRVFAFAHREFHTKPESLKPDDLETELIFDGFCGIEDDIHPEVPKAIEYCHEAGIKIVMITGDYKVTAASTARKINIAGGKQFRMVSGEQLKNMRDLELRENLLHPVVFYQTDPGEKLKIVETLQKMGMVVAVTGDGVNDALALKKADIGVAMGKVGTDVAKEAADMVLLDDNFATIVNAVKEGRIIWDNLKKFLDYVFSGNFGEFAVILLSLLFRLPYAMLAVQILMIDASDVPTSISLASEPGNKSIIHENHNSAEKLLTKSALIDYMITGTILGIGAVLTFWFINGHGPAGTELYRRATTEAFATLAIGQIFNVFLCRIRHTKIDNFFNNPGIWWGILVHICFVLLIIYSGPFQRVFSTSALGFHDWLWPICWATMFLIVERVRMMFAIKNRMIVRRVRALANS